MYCNKISCLRKSLSTFQFLKNFRIEDMTKISYMSVPLITLLMLHVH